MAKMTPEGEVKNEIKMTLEDNGIAYSLKTTMGYGKSGWPDFDVVLRGIYVTIEAKYDAADEGPTVLQRRTMEKIRASGGVTLVIDIMNYPRLEKLIDLVDEAAKTVPLTPEVVRRFAKALGLLYEEPAYD